MYQRVKAYIKKNEMILPGDQVIAGVSGGGDSMAMLDVLCRYAEEIPFSLHVIHVNHQIRGAEADRDCRLVEETCKDRNVPCHVYTYPVLELAKRWKVGLEEAGRTVRKQAFQEEKKCLEVKPGRVRIALAHNQDDLAETMLHHLARGTGIRGLCAMRPVSGEIIRPVLCLEKKQIVNYLEEEKISYILDSSNLSDDYTRNRIRHHILPLLELEVNTAAASHMAQTAYVAAQAEDYLTRKGGEVLQRCKKEEKGYFLGEAFFAAEPIEKAYAVQEALESLAGRRKDFTALHVQKILDLEQMQTGRRIHLPYGILAEKTYGGILLEKEESKETLENGSQIREESWELPWTGRLSCSYGEFCVRIFPWKNQKIEEKKYTKWLDYDKIKSKLFVRTRRTGDFMVVDNKGSRKKVSRVMIDDKIPGRSRGDIPLVAAGSEILWIVGGRINESYKVTPQTGRVLELQYQGGIIHE